MNHISKIERLPAQSFAIRDEISRAPIAFCSMDEQGEICGLYVDNHYRRLGLATKLVSFVESLSPYNTVEAHVHCRHFSAQKFFEQMGYRQDHKFRWQNGEEFIVYKKILKRITA